MEESPADVICKQEDLNFSNTSSNSDDNLSLNDNIESSMENVPVNIKYEISTELVNDESTEINECENMKMSTNEDIQENESAKFDSSSNEDSPENKLFIKRIICYDNGIVKNECDVNKDNYSDILSENQFSIISDVRSLPLMDLNNIKIEVEDEPILSEKEYSQIEEVINQSCCSAFTQCQEGGSGTDDSESDSDSSDSESSPALSASGGSTSSEEEKVIRKPTKPRNGKVFKEAVVKQIKKKKGGLYKGELDIDDLPPIEDLQITVQEEKCEPLGTVCSIVNKLVVIQSMEHKPVLNLDSLLFKKDGECLGQIFDVFGPVKTPYYTLRFNSREEITKKGIEVKQTIYCAPQTPHTNYVFVYQLMKQKGTDASWKHNYEVPDSLVDYSDDEEEKRAKRKQNQKTRDRPYRQNDHGTAQKIRPHMNPEFMRDYNRCGGNEWYKARVSELNQFHRPSQNQHYSNNFPQQQHNVIVKQETQQPSYPLPPSLLRPPTLNNWSVPTSNVPPYGQSTQVGVFCTPSSSFCPQSHSGSQYFPNQFPPSQSFTPPPHISYEKLNSAVQFTNPILQFPNLLTPPPPPPPTPPPQFTQTSLIPIRIDNTHTNLTSVSTLLPNASYNISPNCIPPQSISPVIKQEPTYFNQPPPNF